MFALQIPPGKSRQYAFMDWPGFLPELWSATLNPSELEPRGSRTEVKIKASDRDEGAIQIAICNAQRAGVEQYIYFSSRSVSDIQPEGKGWLITNPPYGIRINQNKDLRNLYAQFGNILRSKCRGWNFSIMCNDMTLLRQLQLPLDAQLSLVNGGIPVRVARGTIPE
jgi:putative N6-adenine-specific DNA methylase